MSCNKTFHFKQLMFTSKTNLSLYLLLTYFFKGACAIKLVYNVLDISVILFTMVFQAEAYNAKKENYKFNIYSSAFIFVWQQPEFILRGKMVHFIFY